MVIERQGNDHQNTDDGIRYDFVSDKSKINPIDDRNSIEFNQKNQTKRI